MNRIRELREEKRMTQVRLSIELEVSQENISAYENGKYYPSVKSLLKMRDIFNASIDYILGVSEHRTEPVQNFELNHDEYDLVRLYKSLDTNGKALVKTYMQGYLDSFYNHTKA